MVILVAYMVVCVLGLVECLCLFGDLHLDGCLFVNSAFVLVG